MLIPYLFNIGHMYLTKAVTLIFMLHNYNNFGLMNHIINLKEQKV